jgi:NAD(P)-dependent dehydrogenase (short-subunit alcohol dehydrogenase family)
MELATAKAVITGGASGLGFATAQRVIDAGGQVVLLDINDELGASSAAQLGERASYINTDVSNEESVRAAINTANETMGGITLAVNCAGIATAGRSRTSPTMTASVASLSVPHRSPHSKARSGKRPTRHQKVVSSA